MCRIALIATAALAAVGARTWYEHVPSDDNPADVLSRAGLEDPAVRAAIQAGTYLVRQPIEPPEGAELDYSYWWRKSSDMDAPGAGAEDPMGADSVETYPTNSPASVTTSRQSGLATRDMASPASVTASLEDGLATRETTSPASVTASLNYGLATRCCDRGGAEGSLRV